MEAYVEGADFGGADLRSANLTGASTFGTTFCQYEDFSSPIMTDSSTVLDEAAIEKLLPPEQQFIRQALGK